MVRQPIARVGFALLLLAGTVVALVRGPIRARGDEEPGAAGAALAKAAATAKVGLADAVRAAEQELHGRAVRAALEIEDGGVQMSVLLRVGEKEGRWVERTVDANTGAVLETDAEEAPDGDEKGERDEKDEKDEKDEPGEKAQAAGEEREKANAPASPKRPAERAFTDRFDLDPADLGPTGRNPYCVLEPGYALVFQSPKDATHQQVVTVLDETRTIEGVTTRVVEELETRGGEELERSRNYLAISKRTNDVYYFGEETGGGWLAGQGGARPGLFVPATPLLGGRYRMEVAPKQAMDGGEIVAVDERFTCPAGTFEHCVRVTETTPLEPGAKEDKVYAPGVGLVYDDGLVLVRYGKR